jgi:hypothetical protein
MASKLTRLTHKITIQPHLVADSCIICSSRSRRPVRKHLDTSSYLLFKYLLLHYAATRLAETCVEYSWVKQLAAQFLRVGITITDSYMFDIILSFEML